MIIYNIKINLGIKTKCLVLSINLFGDSTEASSLKNYQDIQVV